MKVLLVCRYFQIILNVAYICFIFHSCNFTMKNFKCNLNKITPKHARFDHQLFLSNKINNGPMYVCCCCCSTNCVVVVKKAAKNPEKKRDSFLLQLFPSHNDFRIILIQMYFSWKTFLKAKHVYWNTFEINNFNQLIFK